MKKEENTEMNKKEVNEKEMKKGDGTETNKKGAEEIGTMKEEGTEMIIIIIIITIISIKMMIAAEDTEARTKKWVKKEVAADTKMIGKEVGGIEIEKGTEKEKEKEKEESIIVGMIKTGMIPEEVPEVFMMTKTLDQNKITDPTDTKNLGFTINKVKKK